jgi:CRP-like cAMP-binding protein
MLHACFLPAESTQLGWLSRGDSFGEAALVNPAQQRPVSVVAGDDGCMLLVLDRACFNRLQQQAQERDALAAAALQAVLAAACRPILRVGGRTRSAEEVETLAELFSGLEVRVMPAVVHGCGAVACCSVAGIVQPQQQGASLLHGRLRVPMELSLSSTKPPASKQFILHHAQWCGRADTERMGDVHGAQAFKSMPQPVRSRLAKACQGVQLPAGAVVFEEDDKGDAMYVVVSGSLSVRARPLQASTAAMQRLQELPAQHLGSASGGGGSDAAAAHNGPGIQEGSVPGGAGARQMRATADAVCAGPSGNGDGGSGVRGQLKGSRRTTWEGAAFTAKEQGRLDAVRTALQAERLQVSVQVLQTHILACST